jgi:uncharacterized protein
METGFVIPDERDELSILRLRYKTEAFNSRNYTLMIYPTQDCNLKCWYCYENHVPKSAMNQEIQERVVKHINSKIDNDEIDSLHVIFFGGEPLMYFNKIAYPLSMALKKTMTIRNKSFSAFFITNGTLITENVIEQMKDIMPFFQITIDGYRDKHDQVRIGKLNNMPTYDRIIKAVHYITENLESPIENTSRIVNLRINYDNETLKHIEDIVKDIQDINRDKISIHFERVWQTKKDADDEQRKLLIDAMKLCTYNGFVVDHGLFRQRSVSCPSETSLFAIINYNGLVYRCNGRNLTEDTNEGYLNYDGEITWNHDKIARRLGNTTFENPMCIECKMLPFCMGPCSQKNIENDWKNLDEVCSLNAIDISLTEYITLDFEMRYLLKQAEKITL